MPDSFKLNDLEVNDGTVYALMLDSFKPRPATRKQTFADSPLVDGQRYISGLGKDNNVELPFSIRVQGTSGADKRAKVQALIRELRKDSITVTVTRTGEDPYYYDATPPAEEDTDRYWELAYQLGNLAVITFTLQAGKPRYGWRELYAFRALGPNDSFEKRSVNDFENWVETVSGGTITADTTNFCDPLTGGCSCKLTTTNAAHTTQLQDADAIAVDASHHHNIKMFAYLYSGTATLDLDLLCYDNSDTLLGTLNILTAYNPSTATTWLDAVKRAGSPVVYPEGSTSSPCFPTGTTKVKRQIRHDTTVGVISIDKLLLMDSEYIVGHEYEGVMGISIPGADIETDEDALANVYFGNSYSSGMWSGQNSGLSQVLRAIWGLDSTHVWAVGDDGKIIFHNGVSWALQTSGTSLAFYGVRALDSTHVWAVGADGVITFYNGAAWAPQTFPASVPIFNDGVESAGVWSFYVQQGSADRVNWNQRSGSWCGQICPAIPWSGSGTSYARMMNANYISVNREKTYTVSWYYRCSLYADPHNGCRLKLTVYYYDASNNNLGNTLLCNILPNDDDAYHALSQSFGPAQMPAGTVKVKLYFYCGLVGVNEAVFVYIDDISIVQTDIPDLMAVTAVNSTNAWACGQYGTIAKYNGTSWAEQSSGVTCCLYGISALDTTHVWAVGADGTILFHNGTTWVAQTSGTSEDLCAVYALDSTHVWAVGDNGTVLFFNGASWSVQTSNTTEDLRGVYAYNSTNIWACGVSGKIMYGNGTGWAAQESGTLSTLYGISGISATRVWAVGGAGTIRGGISTATPLAFTNIIVGQRPEYHVDWNPVADAPDNTPTPNYLYTRRRQSYRSTGASTSVSFLFPVASHRGRHMIAVGMTFSGATSYDKATLNGLLQNAAGTDITSSVVTQEVDMGDPAGVWKDVILLATRFSPWNLPTHYVSDNADLENIYQVLRMIAHASLGAVSLYIDYLAIIPIDYACVEVTSWAGTYMILESSSGRVLSSLDGSLDTAMIYTVANTLGRPAFTVGPAGVNMTVLMVNIESGAHNLKPVSNMLLRWRPQFALEP